MHRHAKVFYFLTDILAIFGFCGSEPPLFFLILIKKLRISQIWYRGGDLIPFFSLPAEDKFPGLTKYSCGSFFLLVNWESGKLLCSKFMKIPCLCERWVCGHKCVGLLILRCFNVAVKFICWLAQLAKLFGFWPDERTFVYAQTCECDFLIYEPS